MRFVKTAKLIMVSCFAMMLVSCGGGGSTDSGKEITAVSADAPVSVAVAAGVRSNVNEISANAAELGSRIYECAYTHGTISLIRVDGKPEEYLRTDIPKSSVEGLSKRKLEEIATGYRNEILAQFAELGMAKYPEADTLDAIRLAANSLKTVSEGDKYLVVVDSGLATAGYLNFAKDDLFNTATEDIVNELARNMAVPDLTGVKVIWLYAGETAEPQERLSEVQKAKLIEIWEAVLREGNAAEIDFRPDSPSSTPYTGLPSVTLIKGGDRSIDVEPISRIVLDSSTVTFKPDQAEFENPERAKAAIYKVAETLLAHPENKVYIAGCTASFPGREDSCLTLSEERAEAVMNELAEDGVPFTQMKAVGFGSAAPWHVNDLDGNGNQIEEYAKQNRCVVVLDYFDPEYGEWIEDYLN